MKILQIIQRNQLRGAEIFACQLSSLLVQRGQEVDVLVLFGEDTGLLDYNLNFIYLHANEKRRWWDWSAYKRLNEIIRSEKYDLVQANAGDTLKYASLSKTFFGWRARLFFRNANKISDFMTNLPKKLINRMLMKKVEWVASVSDECREDFIKLFPSFSDKISALPIGTDLHDGERYFTLEKLGIEGTGPFILHAGSFVPEKNHAGLLRIFSGVLELFPDAQLLLAGDGKKKDAIKELVSQMQLENKVHFLGARKDLSKIMPCCQVLAFPSLIEGLPAVILEAFASRLPVVAYAVGGIPEVVKPGVTGCLVPKNDEAGFIIAVNNLLQSGTEKIKENAFLLVTEKYSNQKIASAFLSSYQVLLSVNDLYGHKY